MIFYDQIKGCAAKNDETNLLSEGTWNYIVFQNDKRNSKTSPAPAFETSQGLNENDHDSYGQFILSGDEDEGASDSQYKFTQKICTPIDICGIHFRRSDDNTASLRVQANDASGTLSITGYKINYSAGGDSLNRSNGTFTLKRSDVTIQASNSINFTGAGVNAPYFNATSDRRAKTNIQPADFDATALIDRLPVYTFDYKNRKDGASIGIMAQDAALFDGAIPNFSLVVNEKASGKDGDYRSIKESKLIYILWKSVQEQSKRIQELEEIVSTLMNQSHKNP